MSGEVNPVQQISQQLQSAAETIKRKEDSMLDAINKLSQAVATRSATIRSLQEENLQIKNSVQDLTGQLETANQEKAGALEQVATLTNEVAQNKLTNKALSSQLGELQQTVFQQQNQLEEQNSIIRQLEEQLKAFQEQQSKSAQELEGTVRDALSVLDEQ